MRCLIARLQTFAKDMGEGDGDEGYDDSISGTSRNSNEVYGALSHVRKPSPKTWEKVAETKKGDDGVLPVRLRTLMKYTTPYRTSYKLGKNITNPGT